MQLNSIKSGKKKHYISIFPDILIINQRVFIGVQETPDLKGTREQGDKFTGVFLHFQAICVLFLSYFLRTFSSNLLVNLSTCSLANLSFASRSLVNLSLNPHHYFIRINRRFANNRRTQSILRKITTHSSLKCNAIFARLETHILSIDFQSLTNLHKLMFCITLNIIRVCTFFFVILHPINIFNKDCFL